MKILKTESDYPISRAKRGCFKRRGELVLIKSRGGVEQGLEMEKSTILNEKANTKSLFYIKSQKGVLVSRNRKTYHPIKGQNGESIPYQELKVV